MFTWSHVRQSIPPRQAACLPGRMQQAAPTTAPHPRVPPDNTTTPPAGDCRPPRLAPLPQRYAMRVY
ncbi:hypothetical protein E2C01_040841 [Portunus trituberculatus]|uniref:Uncharacterized protein n=1 Tax=Portunus trituberculatus TaxID=210409 RepID=A0A5B7FNS0_PORTR|nr:hypothetical protein [Portunus trituberculatus]